MSKNIRERHLVISDVHVPDYNKRLLELVFEFIKDYRPDTLHILGDFVNFTSVSKYDPDPFYHVSIIDEIDMGRSILEKLRKITKCQIIWHEGNHENRLVKYLARNAAELAELSLGDEMVLSIPHLFNLKELGIEWLTSDNYYLLGDVILTHGNLIRSKGGYTAQAMMERLGMSGISGHTHRLSYVSKTQFGKTKFWIESGCLCNLNPTPAYSQYPDWQQGWATLDYDRTENLVTPRLYPFLT